MDPLLAYDELLRRRVGLISGSYTDLELIGFASASATVALNVSKNIIKGRCPQVESVISKDSQYSFRYAMDVLKGPFPDGEESIACSARESLVYAKLIGKRFSLGEPMIATNLDFSYRYSKDVLNGRFPLGERLFTSDADYAFGYAINVLKSRFLAGEDVIKKTDYLWNQYRTHFKM